VQCRDILHFDAGCQVSTAVAYVIILGGFTPRNKDLCRRFGGTLCLHFNGDVIWLSGH
jgi:hypothetical protein